MNFLILGHSSRGVRSHSEAQRYGLVLDLQNFFCALSAFSQSITLFATPKLALQGFIDDYSLDQIEFKHGMARQCHLVVG